MRVREHYRYFRVDFERILLTMPTANGPAKDSVRLLERMAYRSVGRLK